MTPPFLLKNEQRQKLRRHANHIQASTALLPHSLNPRSRLALTRSNADLDHEVPIVRMTRAKLGEGMHDACETFCVSEVRTTPHVCRPSIGP